MHCVSNPKVYIFILWFLTMLTSMLLKATMEMPGDSEARKGARDASRPKPRFFFFLVIR